MSHREVAKLLQAEGWFSPKTTVYYIEFRIRSLREKGHSGYDVNLSRAHP